MIIKKAKHMDKLWTHSKASGVALRKLSFNYGEKAERESSQASALHLRQSGKSSPMRWQGLDLNSAHQACELKRAGRL